MTDSQSFPGGTGDPNDHGLGEYRDLIGRCNMNVLGVPRDPALIQNGFHPITPERVIVLADTDIRRLRDDRHEFVERLRQEEAETRQRWPTDAPQPPEKLCLCVYLMQRLASHCDRADLSWDWARTLWRRELLGSTGIGFGFCVLHDFQHPDHVVHTDNEVVDWWLVLVPGGVDWNSIDDEPVYYMVGPVMEQRLPGTYLRVMEGITRAMRPLVMSEGFDPAAWSRRMAAMPAEEAAREFNLMAVQSLGMDSRRG